MQITFDFADGMVAGCESVTGLKGQAAVEKVVQEAIEPLHKRYLVGKAVTPAQMALNAALDRAKAIEDTAREAFKVTIAQAEADADAEFKQAIV